VSWLHKVKPGRAGIDANSARFVQGPAGYRLSAVPSVTAAKQQINDSVTFFAVEISW